MLTFPDGAVLDVHMAEQLVALLLFQYNVVACPAKTGFGLAKKLTVVAAGRNRGSTEKFG